MQETAQVANATVERLPKYLAYLKIRQKQGLETISSTRIAEDLRLNAVLVRKDLASVCGAGRPKTGFPVDVLIADLEAFLRVDNARDAFLVGAGRLGQALLGYRPFAECGLNILAAFDVAPALIGREFDGRPVLPLRKLPDLTARMGVRIGILAVPAEDAQTICDLMVSSGIRGVWNFTPAQLEVPARVVLRSENPAASFAVLSRQLAAVFDKEKIEGGTQT